MRSIILVLVTLFLPVFCSAESASPETDLITGPPRGPWRRLFLDAMVVEQSQGLQRVFHPVKKYEGNPVLRADKPYETVGEYSGPYLYGTVLRDQGKLRMWYHLIYQGAYSNAYAESQDGIHWEKPALGIVEVDGATDNNLFLRVSDDLEMEPPEGRRGQCHNPSVIPLAREPDPEKKYALFCYGADWGVPRVAYSPDGLHWKFVPETARQAMFPSSDVINFFFDPYQGQFVATRKLSSRRGRSVGIALSKNGFEWTLPVEGPVFVPDDLDPDATQIYGMPVFPYQGLYIGMPWIYHARWFKYGDYSTRRLHDAQKDSPNTVDVQLAWSWDLVNWTRWREPFFPLGQEGNWDDEMIYTARSPIVMGDELWFYYGGFDKAHDIASARGNIGLATLRLDGFCSMSAGDEEGWLISRREPMKAPRVTINARTEPGGYLTAEILDDGGRVLEGFSRTECEEFRGDSVNHVLRWKTDHFSGKQNEGDKKIRFYLKRGELYSYLPEL